MSPFQEFRFWARRAPVSERAVAGVAAVLAALVFAWLLVPASASSSTDLAISGSDFTEGTAAPIGGVTDTTIGDAAAADAGGGAGAQSGGTGGAEGGATLGGATGTGGATPLAPGATRACPQGSAKGITASQVKVGIGIVEIGGPAANDIFGVATPEAQKAAFNAAIDAANADGGAGCKKIVPQFFILNPTNQEELTQRCREAADAGVFAFLDAGGYTTYPAVECFGQRKIAYFGGYFGNSDRNGRNYPYLFNLNLLDTTYRNALLVLKARGSFGEGFKKLGFLYRNCDMPLVNATKQTIREVVPESTVVEYTVGCPQVFADPAAISQAILTFQRAGVTHVTTLGMLGDMSNFTKTAEQQGFRPKYVIADDGIISISKGSQAPDPANFANAIAITTNRGGEEETPGMTPTAGTVRCNKIYGAKGIKPVWEQPAAIGNACNQVWMLKAAMDNAASLSTDALADGLQKAGSIDSSFPQGPTDYRGVPRTTTGGQFYRVAQYFEDCACWRVIDRDFKPILR